MPPGPTTTSSDYAREKTKGNPNIQQRKQTEEEEGKTRYGNSVKSRQSTTTACPTNKTQQGHSARKEKKLTNKSPQQLWDKKKSPVTPSESIENRQRVHQRTSTCRRGPKREIPSRDPQWQQFHSRPPRNKRQSARRAVKQRKKEQCSFISACHHHRNGRSESMTQETTGAQ